MINGLKRSALLFPVIMVPVILSACVSQSKYDALKAESDQLQAQNQQLQQQAAADRQQIDRLRGAIKYTVNSDLLFPSGGWQLSAEGQRIIGRMAERLVPTQENKLVVNGYTDNAPIGPRLQREGITSNEILSQKRAENVMQFLISKGLNPSL